MREKIGRVIKEKIFMKIGEEAARQYESSRQIAIREALEIANEVKQKENEDKRIQIKCNEIKEQCINDIFSLLFKAFSQSVMVDI
jgi:hypothetical protein